MSLEKTPGTQAPAVAGLEASKAEFRARRHAFADGGRNLDRAAHRIDQLLRDRQPKAGAAVLAGRRAIDLIVTA